MGSSSGTAAATPSTPLLAEKVVAAFGVLQVSLFLGSAVYRLTPLAIEPWTQHMLSSPQQLLFVAWMGLMLYSEGYRGFHLRFCPRVVARAAQLGRDPRPLDLLLALPFCMTLIRAERRKLVARWSFIIALYTLIVFVRMLPQPWRGIVDGGVVVGLAAGIVSLWWIFAQYASGKIDAATLDPA